MIDICCICGNVVETKFELNFENLLGAEKEIYCQKVGICKKCGYIFTQNSFTEEQLNNRYKNMSKFEYDTDEYILDFPYKEQCVRQRNFLMENIDFEKINSVLEIGAASGYNLSLYLVAGKRVMGIEPSEANCRLAQKKYQVEMFQGMFQEYLQLERKNSFDLIILSMTLEHIVNPAKFILDCRQLCDRYFFIEVPTLDIRHKEESMGIFAEEHVSLFTLDSLNVLMNKCGFNLVNVENIYGLNRFLPAGYPSIATIWEKSDSPKPPFRYNLFTSEELIDKYISDSISTLRALDNKIDKIPQAMKLGIWGIGHHASMLLANTSLKSKNIVKVYDSDSRKHSMLFAGIEISSFNKKDVEDGTVEGLLITTYTAQKAIQTYIKKQNINCPIFVLYDI